MKRIFIFLIILSFTVMLTPAAFATNGTNLIGIGGISRAMGGVGIAQPLDAISAVFANPAAMCFGEYCPGSEFNFSGTAFMPKIDAKVTNAGTPGLTTAEHSVPMLRITFIRFRPSGFPFPWVKRNQLAVWTCGIWRQWAWRGLQRHVWTTTSSTILVGGGPIHWSLCSHGYRSVYSAADYEVCAGNCIIRSLQVYLSVWPSNRLRRSRPKKRRLQRFCIGLSSRNYFQTD